MKSTLHIVVVSRTFHPAAVMAGEESTQIAAVPPLGGLTVLVICIKKKDIVTAVVWDLVSSPVAINYDLHQETTWHVYKSQTGQE
jgi:hypothetical protein